MAARVVEQVDQHAAQVLGVEDARRAAASGSSTCSTLPLAERARRRRAPTRRTIAPTCAVGVDRARPRASARARPPSRRRRCASAARRCRPPCASAGCCAGSVASSASSALACAIAASGLRISCAMPAETRPIAASFSWRLRACTLRRSSRNSTQNSSRRRRLALAAREAHAHAQRARSSRARTAARTSRPASGQRAVGEGALDRVDQRAARPARRAARTAPARLMPSRREQARAPPGWRRAPGRARSTTSTPSCHLLDHQPVQLRLLARQLEAAARAQLLAREPAGQLAGEQRDDEEAAAGEAGLRHQQRRCRRRRAQPSQAAPSSASVATAAVAERQHARRQHAGHQHRQHQQRHVVEARAAASEVQRGEDSQVDADRREPLRAAQARQRLRRGAAPKRGSSHIADRQRRVAEAEQRRPARRAQAEHAGDASVTTSATPSAARARDEGAVDALERRRRRSTRALPRAGARAAPARRRRHDAATRDSSVGAASSGRRRTRRTSDSSRRAAPAAAARGRRTPIRRGVRVRGARQRARHALSARALGVAVRVAAERRRRVRQRLVARQVHAAVRAGEHRLRRCGGVGVAARGRRRRLRARPSSSQSSDDDSDQDRAAVLHALSRRPVQHAPRARSASRRRRAAAAPRRRRASASPAGRASRTRAGRPAAPANTTQPSSENTVLWSQRQRAA